MTTTCAYRLTRIANDLELLASANRRQITMALRDEAMAAAMERAELLALFRTTPAQAWGGWAIESASARGHASHVVACDRLQDGV
ncbi:hypothetical protein K2Z83_20240 [Oscillochloris sp. ZM17-4]|uniref:hypothetical protein n=1 Tax=Oscillochloris sp. ZM17-4 TaxID=2866714 RepID=UPI001C732587|nr:hypothetical protein [Oscillochloris sp. ZM17-4]MBX0330001.1 hypothetical protein [Oscillochloris sp. ZM17-4]